MVVRFLNVAVKKLHRRTESPSQIHRHGRLAGPTLSRGDRQNHDTPPSDPDGARAAPASSSVAPWRAALSKRTTASNAMSRRFIPGNASRISSICALHSAKTSGAPHMDGSSTGWPRRPANPVLGRCGSTGISSMQYPSPLPVMGPSPHGPVPSYPGMTTILLNTTRASYEWDFRIHAQLRGPPAGPSIPSGLRRLNSKPGRDCRTEIVQEPPGL